MDKPQTTPHNAIRQKVKLARALGRLDGIEEAAKRVENADNTMMPQKTMARYVRELKND